jgi:hypothetical protein
MQRRDLRFHLLALSLYSALAMALTWPLVLNPSSSVPHDALDPLLNAWLLWWNSRSVPFSAEWWSPSFFFPIQGALSLSETLVGLSPLTTPLLQLGASPLLAHNVVYLLSFPLSSLALHALVFEISRRRDLAIVGGLAYGFAPYRAAHLAHLQILCAFWIPLVFLGLHVFVRTGRRRWLLLFAGAWLAQGLTNGYYLLFVSVLLPPWIAWFVAPDRRWRRALSIALAWLAAAAVLLPALSEYPRWQSALAFERSRWEVESMSADVFGLISPPPLLANWTLNLGVNPESWIFPGVTLPATVLVFLAGWRRRAGRAAPFGWLSVASAGAAALAALVAAITALHGPWEVKLAGVMLSGAALRKPLAVAFYGLVIAVASSQGFRDAWRRSSPVVFYILAAAAALALALGPNPHAGAVRIWEAAPYGVFANLPGFAGLRAPARFAMLAVFGLSCGSALALGRLVPSSRPGASLRIALVAAGILWDGWIRPLPTVSVPSPLPAKPLAEIEPAAALLELPLGPARDATALYSSVFHRRPLVNGYSGFFPRHYLALRSGLETGDAEVLRVLRRRRPLLVLLDGQARDAERLAAFVTAGREGGRPLPTLNGRLRPYLLSRLEARPPAPALGSRIVPRDVRGARGSIVCDLGHVERVGSLVLSFGHGVASLPERVTVEIAGTARDWTAVWNGPVAGLAMEAALHDPRRVPVRLDTPGASGRFIRLRFHATPSIEDLALFRPTGE